MDSKLTESKRVEDESSNKNKKLKNKRKFVFKYIKLHRKIFIIFGTITIIMLGGVYLVAHTIFLDSFEIIEENETKKQIRQATNVLSQEIFQLKSFNQDYAVWDATYKFIKDKNSFYIEENLIDETFLTNEWNAFILIDIHGNFIYQKGFDLDNKREASISPHFLNQLKLQSPLFRLAKPTDCVTGTISLPEGYMMVSSHPVVTSYFKGPIRGWLVLGRYINSHKINQLSKESKISFALEKFTQDLKAKNTEVFDLSLINKSIIWAESKNEDYISGYSLIYDIYGQPAFVLKVNKPRDIYNQVNLSVKYFMGIVFLIGGTYFLATWFFMNKFIFNRLKILMSSVSEIGKNRDLSTRVSILLKDEFSSLESEFNTMLEALEESQKKLIYQSHHDDLTHLFNRHYFYDQVKQWLIQVKGENRIASILFFDIDKFKGINDSLGHETGDLIIKSVSKRIKDYLYKDSIISRIGGDEFIAFLPDKGEKIVKYVAENIVEEIKKPFFINDKQIFLTASIGISLYPFDGDNVETLINNADIAMYGAKKESNRRFKFYTSDMRNRVSSDMLRSALEKNELQLYYQPKVNAVTKTIEGMETLLRWSNSKYGAISPMEFIPLAEETGLIIPIGEWVLKRACLQNRKWQDLGYNPIRVAVNISSIQFMQPDFIRVVKKTLEETKLNEKYLELEITESVALNKEEEVIEKLLILKDMGIQISIDDFGTGYSSLSYLQRLPVDSLKIDRSFIKNIGSDSTIIKMIIGMAQSLELSIVAEGVETKEQLDYLMNLGCKYMQGYLFSRPVPAEKFEKLLADNGIINN